MKKPIILILFIILVLLFGCYQRTNLDSNATITSKLPKTVFVKENYYLWNFDSIDKESVSIEFSIDIDMTLGSIFDGASFSDSNSKYIVTDLNVSKRMIYKYLVELKNEKLKSLPEGLSSEDSCLVKNIIRFTVFDKEKIYLIIYVKPLNKQLVTSECYFMPKAMEEILHYYLPFYIDDLFIKWGYLN